MGIGFKHGVEDDQQLAHASGDDNFKRFARGFESLSEGADDRVAAFGGEGGHVQGAADRGTSAPDGALTPKGSAVMVEGSQPDQRANLLTVESSEFRKVRQEGHGDRGADAGCTLQDFSLVAPVVVRFEEGEDAFLDSQDVLVEAINHALNALADVPRGARFEPVGLSSPQIDQLPTANDELLEFGLFLRGFGNGAWTDVLAKAGEDRGMQRIGLGQ